MTVEDDFGDGLTYGYGSYTVSWRDGTWQSFALGNYATGESLKVCPYSMPDDAVTSLVVFVEIGSNESLHFLEYLDTELLPLFEHTVDYEVVVTNIYEANGSDNSADCYDGYCLNNTYGAEVTIENALAALCFTTWQNWWSENHTTNSPTMDPTTEPTEEPTGLFAVHVVQNVVSILVSF